MTQIYGDLWNRKFGSVGGEAFEVWGAGLNDLNDEQLLHGIENCLKRGSQWPPNLPEFRSLCIGDPEDHGLPDHEEAYYEAARYAGKPSTRQWSHGAVYVAGRKTGWKALRFEPESVTKPVFQRNYDIACRRAMAGEDLEAEIPEGLPDNRTVTKPVSREEGKRRMRELLQELESDA